MREAATNERLSSAGVAEALTRLSLPATPEAVSALLAEPANQVELALDLAQAGDPQGRDWLHKILGDLVPRTVSVAEINAALRSLDLRERTIAELRSITGQAHKNVVQAVLAVQTGSQPARDWLVKFFGERAAPQDPPPEATAAPAAAPAPTAPSATKRVVDHPAAHGAEFGREAGRDDFEVPGAFAKYWSEHVYGRFAFAFDATTGPTGRPTVGIDAAERAPGAGRQAPGLWDDKIRLHLTAIELPEVIAVLLGWLPRCEFKHHGPAKDKGFELEHQGQNLFIKVFRPKTVRAVAIDPEGALRVAHLMLHQFCRARGLMSADGICDFSAAMNLIKTVYVPMRLAPKR